jgi:FKBP-type peptidyl-prolyl cis-trans isomerase
MFSWKLTSLLWHNSFIRRLLLPSRSKFMLRYVLGTAVLAISFSCAVAQDSTTQTTPPGTPAPKKTTAKKPASATAAKAATSKAAATKTGTAAKPTVHHTPSKTAAKTAVRKKAPVTKVDPNAPTPVQGAGTTTASGLQYWDIKPGTGAIAAAGQKVEVQYTGWLTDGHKFDSSVGTGRNFAFMLGQGQVIKGWDEGVAGMKVGGKRQLRIPPQLAYGDRGFPGAIPAGSTLVFDVELKGVAAQ